MRPILFLAFFLSISNFSIAQKGKLEGKVTDSKTGNRLSGVTVTTGRSAAASDLDGNFVITLEAGKKYTLTISSVGYKTKQIDEVEVEAGKTTNIEIVLEGASKTESAVVVRSSAKKETAAALIAYQKNTSVVAQVISAETIKRSPDKNTGEVLKRISGTSIQEGKYLVVRGLADRYNQAMLNGVLLSSTEPDRKTFSFDIFPSAIIDNIIINKAFIPELSGEWAGGLVQVNTKDIPSQNFFNVQLGTGFNTNVPGNKFYKSVRGRYDFLGIDDGTRALPAGMPTKSRFASLDNNQKTALGASFPNNWRIKESNATPNASFQMGSGFTGKIFKKKAGGTIALTYNRSVKHYKFNNSFYSISDNKATPDFIYHTDKYAAEVLWGGIANFSLQFNNNNKITVKNLFNLNSSDYTSLRTGYEALSVNTAIRAKEISMKTNIFYNTQIGGEHNLTKIKAKLNWFGGFNILDQFIPGQRRSEYFMNDEGQFIARISSGQSQKSGSIFYGNLSDYIYTAGGDVTKFFGNKQIAKAGYFLQIKDRLYDAMPFFAYVNNTSAFNSINTLPEVELFDPSNFKPGGAFALDRFTEDRFRYLANSILNAGYIQFDNSIGDKWRAVWGLRVEDFDQIVGSVKMSDPRFNHTYVKDYLPALNLTYKTNTSSNLRFAVSQTVVRPEFRELTDLAFYDFELGATVVGNKNLERTKITNADLRYELYPRAGELLTFGVFYKYFNKPIEQNFNSSGAGSSNTFNYNNANKAISYGVEADLRKKLDFIPSLRNFTLSSNVSYIYNRVKFATKALDRPMQGQSPYMINAALQYDLPGKGFTTTFLFNKIGRRILYVGNEQVPAIWEAPRPLLDVQVAKKLLNNKAEIKLNVSDLLNKEARFYHDLDQNKKFGTQKDAVAISRNYGTTFGLTFGYNFR